MKPSFFIGQTGDPYVWKMVVQSIMHLAWRVGWEAMVLKPHGHMNIKGYILQHKGTRSSWKSVKWIPPR
jgi:hypothetical protein